MFLMYFLLNCLFNNCYFHDAITLSLNSYTWRRVKQLKILFKSKYDSPLFLDLVYRLDRQLSLSPEL